MKPVPTRPSCQFPRSVLHPDTLFFNSFQSYKFVADESLWRRGEGLALVENAITGDIDGLLGTWRNHTANPDEIDQILK